MLDVIYQRRSIRKFKEDPVSDEIIRELLKCAMAAPSARNMCPWDFYVINNKETQAELRTVTRNFNYESSVMIVVCGNKQKSLTQNNNDFWIQDCSAAVENILLAATSLHIGSLWCGIYPVPERVEKVRTILGVDNTIVPLALVHLGYADEEKEPRTRYSEDCVHYIK